MQEKTKPDLITENLIMFTRMLRVQELDGKTGAGVHKRKATALFGSDGGVGDDRLHRLHTACQRQPQRRSS